VRAWLPIFQDHYVLDFVDGLVLLLHEKDDIVRLLNPLTGDTADLPPLKAPVSWSSGSRYLMCFREVGATSVTVSLDGLITVMIVLLQEVRNTLLPLAETASGLSQPGACHPFRVQYQLNA
jgi:hypothetical protein